MKADEKIATTQFKSEIRIFCIRENKVGLIDFLHKSVRKIGRSKKK